MPSVQQSHIIQSQKHYMLTMPNTSPRMHPYSVAEWRRRGPSLFDDDEAKLQYLTMIGNRDGTLLSAQVGWDDGHGGIMKETRQSRHREGPDRQARKKISLAEYSKKKVSGGRSAEPEGARSTKENEKLTNATCYKDEEARASPKNCQEGYRLLCPGFDGVAFTDLVAGILNQRSFLWRTRRLRELAIVESRCRQAWGLSSQQGAMGLNTRRALPRSEVRRGKLSSMFGTSFFFSLSEQVTGKSRPSLNPKTLARPGRSPGFHPRRKFGLLQS